jgi:hypothetical protein
LAWIGYSFFSRRIEYPCWVSVAIASATPIVPRGVEADGGEATSRRGPEPGHATIALLSTTWTAGVRPAVELGRDSVGVEGCVGGSDRWVDGGGSPLPSRSVRRGGASGASREGTVEEIGDLGASLELRGGEAPRRRRRRATVAREAGAQEDGIGGDAASVSAIWEARARAARQASSSWSVHHPNEGTAPCVAMARRRASSLSGSGRACRSTNAQRVCSSMPEAHARNASLEAGRDPSQWRRVRWLSVSGSAGGFGSGERGRLMKGGILNFC